MPVAIHKSSKKAYGGPDPVVVKDQLQGLQDMLKVWGSENFMRFFFWILRKQEKPDASTKIKVKQGWNKRLVPFSLNRIQSDINNRLTERTICLKPRQVGYTTYYINRRLYLSAITEPGTGNLLISQNGDFAAKHFDIIKRTHKFFGYEDPYEPITDPVNLVACEFHQHLLHTSYSSRKELIFDQLDSRIMVASAEVEEAGQGITLHHCVATEVARWDGKPAATLANVKEAIVLGGSLDLESTANGWGGYFFDECGRAREGKSEFTYFFHPWWWHDEYRCKALKGPHPWQPVTEENLSEEEAKLIERVEKTEKMKLDLFQIGFRRLKKLSLRNEFEEKYPEDDLSCFLMTGDAFFDRQIVSARYREVLSEPPLSVIRNGDLQIFKKRVKGRRYVIGADPATGRITRNTNSDFCAAVVIDIDSGEEVAAIRARVSPEDFAFDLDELARMYNNAVIAVERTGDGGTTILALQMQCMYSNIYKHKEWFKRDRKMVEVEGFPTNQKTRPIALNKLAWFVREYPELVHDKIFLEECLMFVRNEKGKPEATKDPETGKAGHDDTVSCRWIGYYVRDVLLGYRDPMAEPSEKYGDTPSDVAEDEEEAA